MDICKRILYRGRVQGVGFRQGAWDLAQGYQIGGFVRNLADGRVEVLVEGPPEQVEAFLAKLQWQRRHYIADVTVNDEKPTGVKKFEIR